MRELRASRRATGTIVPSDQNLHFWLNEEEAVKKLKTKPCMTAGSKRFARGSRFWAAVSRPNATEFSAMIHSALPSCRTVEVLSPYMEGANRSKDFTYQAADGLPYLSELTGFHTMGTLFFAHTTVKVEIISVAHGNVSRGLEDPYILLNAV